MNAKTLSKLFLTIAGACTAVGGLSAFQAFGNSSPLAHKITAIVMGVGVLCAYLASSPLITGSDAPPAPPTAGKVTGLVLLLSLGIGLTSCAHVQPIASCATAAIEQAIKDALSDANWEAEIAQLVVQDGPAVVECVIEQVIAAESGTEKVAHAKAWKAKHVKYVP